MTRTFTFEEVQQKLLNTWPDFGSGSNEWMELARRVYNTLFSEHARAREKQLHKSIEIFTHGRCFHQLRRDRRNEAELRAAWSRGERTFNGKRMGGGATCPYIYRWERDEVMEVVEMIEEVLREEGTETMTAPIALPQEGSSAVESQEQQIKTTWTALQVAEGQLEKRGLAFGKALYDFRAASEVVQGGTTFRSTLDKLTIPHSTAYVWIDKYAASIGMKKLNKERHPHRGETKSFDPIGANALEIVQAGYATLLDKGEKSPRELQAAKDWTYARLKGQNIATTPSPLATVHTSEGDKSYNYF